MSFGVLMMSHGYFAQEALRSAEMIAGVQDNIEVVSVTIDKSIASIELEIDLAIHRLNTDHGLLILTDILGGTPSNLAAKVLLQKENTVVISGFNLPVLLDLFINRDVLLKDAKNMIEETYKVGYTCLNDKLMAGGDEDEYSID